MNSPRERLFALQKATEKNAMRFTTFITITVAIGGLVEIVPLFTLPQGGQPSAAEARAVAAVKPRNGLEAEGFDLYVREGCYNCHSQMIRPFRHETLRYGPYSLAAEAHFDRPFQYGSRRIGPDLSRIGGKYPDSWHVAHLNDPQAMVPGSLMPRYPWLEKTTLDADRARLVQAKLRAQRTLGVPYTDAAIEAAYTEVLNKTELDAMVAYMQSLGRATKNLAR